MNVTLPQWYRTIIPLLLMTCLLSKQLIASPDCPIVAANFSGQPEGTTVNNSTTGWFLDAGNVNAGAIFWVKSNRLHAQELGGEGVWYSKVFSVSGYTDFQIATKITAEGDMNSSEYVKVYYKINGGAEILLDQRTGNFGTIDFISPLLNGNNVQFVIRIYNYNNGGSQTSKYYIEDYRVFKEHGPCAGGIPVSVSAGNNGVLTCANTSLTLNASSSASGVSYSWTGPGGFTSTASNPVITVAGTYNVNATSSAGSGSASITITENKAAPGVTATGASLGCASSVTINAVSPITNAQYAWAGPASFSSTQQNPVVTAAGTYTVTVTNPANGCTSTQQVQVTAGTATFTAFWLEDFTFANGTTNDTGTTPWTIENPGSGTFSVQNNEFMASFNSANEGVWKSGMINIANKNNVVVSVNLKSGTAGSSDYLEDDDYIRVYYKLNGGPETLIFGDIAGLNGINSGTATAIATSTALNGNTLEIVIRARNSHSTERYYFDNVTLSGYNSGAAPLSASVNGAATCTATAQLSATATRPVSSWAWTGPNGFTSAQQNPAVSAGGQYIVTASFTDGCTASVPVTVTENKTAPGVTASGGSLACFTSIQINANSPLATAQYSWSGPGSFASSLQNPAVSAEGTYTVTVTDPANGCTSIQSVQVTSTTTLPPADLAITRTTSTDTLTCTVNHVIVVASSSTPGTWYTWTGPEGYTANGPGITAFNPGVYTVIAHHPTSGCTDTASYVVHENRTFPGASVTPNLSMLTCLTSNVVITAGANATTVKYSWTMPGGLTATGNTVTATEPGNYYLLVTDTVNGCTTSTTAVVVEGRTVPSGLTITAPSNASAITCTNSQVALTGNAASGNVNYSWSGPGGFQAATSVINATVEGVYTMTATHTASGCTATRNYTVIRDMASPADMVITPAPANAQLTCIATTVTLTGSTSTPGAIYSWSGPSFTSNIANPSVNTAGDYVLTVTNPDNGCTATANITVTSNTTPPAGITAFSSDQLTCFTETVNITGNSGTPGVTYSWTGPNGFTANTRIAPVTAPGPYQLRVTNPANGCFGTAVANVVQNITKPDISVSNTGPLTCDIFEAEIQGSSATPDVDYSWTGPDGFASNSPVEFVFTPGDYILTVLDLNNGCSSTDTTTVLQDLTGCQRAGSGAKAGITQPETAAGKTGLSTQMEYRAYPNPFTNRLNVEFKAPQNAQVNVGIYNAVGAISKVLYNGSAQGGQLYKLPFDATVLPTGVYYCVIRINEKIYTIKLIAIKK